MLKLVPFEIFVNHIIQEGVVTHGIAALDKTVNENLSIIYTGKDFQIISLLLKNPPGAFYLFDRFCQFVVKTQYQPILGLSMKISDYKNDTDSALEDYKKMKDKNWNTEDTDKIMSIFQEIQKDKTNIAKMVLKDPVG